MSFRTVVIARFEDYLATGEDSPEQQGDRQQRLSRFPYTVILKLSYPELDFANRWCWQQFGPRDGYCTQRSSEYPACDLQKQHSHAGEWTTHFFVKTDYNFGFNEWYFARSEDRDQFLANVPDIHWGEKYGE
ncbi:MAG: hypothetical protein ACRC8S_19560 [Fimbriiglobus sp.]